MKRGHAGRAIVVIEPDFRGHRLGHVEAVARVAIDDGWNVTFATSQETIESTEYRERFAARGIRWSVHSLGRMPGDSERVAWVEGRIAELADHYPDARLLVLEGDKLLPWFVRMPRATGRRLTLLVIRGPLLLSRSLRGTLAGWLKAGLFTVAAARRFPLLVLQTGDLPLRYKRRFFANPVPDPVSEGAEPGAADEYRSLHNLDPTVTWCAVLGTISRAKNLDTLLAALQGDRSIGLLVAGKLDADEAVRLRPHIERFESAGGRVRFDDRVMADGDMDIAVSAADVILISQSADGPSGIMGKALAAGKPVLATGSSFLGAEVRRLRAGEASRPERDAMQAAIHRLALRSFTRRPMAAAPDFGRAVLRVYDVK